MLALRLLCLLAVVTTIGGQAQAKTAYEARSAAIAWLEANQNSDGSWGSGWHKPIVTAEALLALTAANRSDGAAAHRSKAWLLSREYTSVDFLARAIRALEAAGVSMSSEALDLSSMSAGMPGWGPTRSDGVAAYDSALALAALDASGVGVPDVGTKRAEVFIRRRADGGWSGDLVPVTHAGLPDSKSGRTTSAEIVRAMASQYGDWSQPGTDRYAAQRFLSSDGAAGGEAVGPASETLELAARLAALHAVGEVDDDPSTGMEPQLLDDSRFALVGTWSDSDAFVNAIGLLAITTKPGASWACGNSDCDGDGVLDPIDPFPYDPTEWADLDGDGIGDNADPDRDGDGICDWTASGPEIGACAGMEQSALLSDDPSDHRDSDGDGIGDNDETDADDDGILDVVELELGTDPTRADSDGDQIADGQDDCPRIAGNVDSDGDGVCAPLDECDGMSDAIDILNLDGDALCDGADADDDDDGFDDRVELVWGSDPRDPESKPDDVAALDPSGDFDLDGLDNQSEAVSYGTSPYLADSDSDGVIDGDEVMALPESSDPADASSRPALVVGVTSSAGASEPPSPGSPHDGSFTAPGLRLTATGAQTTPVAKEDDPQVLSSGIVGIHQAGFQPQTTLGRDLDGDGLSGSEEIAQSTSATNVDTDADSFVDGSSGIVSKSAYSEGYDLDGDSFVEGELSLGTDPSDGADRIGGAGDVAPLGHPDGELDLADTLIGARLLDDPSLLDGLAPDNRDITLEAGDLDGDQEISAGDVLRIYQHVDNAEP